MSVQSRMMWIVAIVVALVVLGQLLAILRWVIGFMIFVAVIGFIVRAVGAGSDGGTPS